MSCNTKKIAIAAACAVVSGMSYGATSSDPYGETTSDVIAVGPVSTVSGNGHEVTVLGRTFHTRDVVALSSGDYVAIHAELSNDGSISGAWVEYLGTYVAGSNLVYERGVVTEIKPFLGQMSIGASKIDYTPSLYSSTGSGPAIGQLVAVSGVQPVDNSTVLVDSLMGAADVARNAVLSGGGTAVASIQGSGVQSASIQGSGFRSASIQGSGVQSASIQGSGFRSASIQGSGVQSASIQGSGFRSASIQGSGVRSASIQGSGVRSASIQGSGVGSN
jgi:hypothetical protein